MFVVIFIPLVGTIQLPAALTEIEVIVNIANNNINFIEFDFIGRIKATGQIFDLTLGDVAKKENVFDEHREYKPTVAVVGAGMLIKGFDKAIEGKEIKKEYEFDVAVEDAFGQRNPKLVQLTNLNKFKEFRPIVGMQVNVDGVLATVRSVSGGRVTLDFNHPLAGRELHYWVKITRKIADLKEKISALAKIMSLDASNVSVEEKKVTIKGKEIDKLDKHATEHLGEQIRKLIPEIKDREIVFEKA